METICIDKHLFDQVCNAFELVLCTFAKTLDEIEEGIDDTAGSHIAEILKPLIGYGESVLSAASEFTFNECCGDCEDDDALQTDDEVQP